MPLLYVCARIFSPVDEFTHKFYISVTAPRSDLHICFAPTTSLFDTDKERKRRTEKGARVIGSFIVKEHFNTKGEYIQPHTSLPLPPSTIHFLQGCTGAEEEEERAEREERERNEKGGEGRARERMLGEKRAELKGSQKKKKNYQRDGAGGGEVGNENETDGGQSRGGK